MSSRRRRLPVGQRGIPAGWIRTILWQRPRLDVEVRARDVAEAEEIARRWLRSYRHPARIVSTRRSVLIPGGLFGEALYIVECEEVRGGTS